MIIEYIKSSIEILLNLRQEDEEDDVKKSQIEIYSNSSEIDYGSNTSSYICKDPTKEYESSLQKLEADVRNHIKLE